MDLKGFRDFRKYLGFSWDFWDFGIFLRLLGFFGILGIFGISQMENHPKGKSFSFICQTGSGFFGFLLGNSVGFSDFFWISRIFLRFVVHLGFF